LGERLTKDRGNGGGTLVSGGQGGAEDKIAAMEAAGIRVSPSPSELGTTLAALLKELALG